jgi:Predicted archaeal kinase (sugar kinase superfamily)
MTARSGVWVPGHITGFFAPMVRADPVRSGSVGGGIALSAGVEVRADAAPQTEISLNGQPTPMPPVQAVLDALEISARIHAETALPLGAGFGVSGAMTLGTALAARAAGLTDGRTAELVRLAHVAEVSSRTGLGDVMGQAHGGVSLRTRAGAPPVGQVTHIEGTPTVEYLIFGPRSTAAVLGETGVRLPVAGRRALRVAQAESSMDGFMRAAATFTIDTGLAGTQVQRVLDRVAATGHTAAMVMLGESIFSCDGGLSAAGYRPYEATVAGGPTAL